MCTSPITVKKKIAGKEISSLVPCGKCSECVKKRQSSYVVRCIEESRKRGRIWFLTLTYNDDHLPYVDGFPSLCRDDLKKWKKEVRRNYFRSFGVKFPDFSFLLCGEYGPRTQRPHYHGLIFGLDKYHIHLLQSYWEDHYGFSVFVDVPFRSGYKNDVACAARYVAKYCIKSKGKVPNDKVESPRVQTSIGFGLPEDMESFQNYVLNGVDPQTLSGLKVKDISIINNRLKYSFDGCDYSLPSYVRKKILYEKNSKGNLAPSKLQKVLSRSLQRESIDNFNKQLREMESLYEEGEVSALLARFSYFEEDSLRSREDFMSKDLLTKKGTF